jgi:hypothetical protein
LRVNKISNKVEKVSAKIPIPTFEEATNDSVHSTSFYLKVKSKTAHQRDDSKGFVDEPEKMLYRDPPSFLVHPCKPESKPLPRLNPTIAVIDSAKQLASRTVLQKMVQQRTITTNATFAPAGTRLGSSRQFQLPEAAAEQSRNPFKPISTIRPPILPETQQPLVKKRKSTLRDGNLLDMFGKKSS